MPTGRDIGTGKAARRPSRAPSGRRTIISLALCASPGEALRGLGWLMRGKRVRGWNLLHLAAAANPAYYSCWIAKAEGRIVQDFCAAQGRARRPLSVGCLILGSGETQARDTLRSLRAALGPVPVWTSDATLRAEGATPVSADAPLDKFLAGLDPQVDWLLPLRAGDALSPVLQTVLAHAAPGPGAAIVYWDEDQMRDGRRRDPWIKPGWDAMLLGDGAGVMGAGLMAVPALRAAAAGRGACVDLPGTADAVRRVLSVSDNIVRLPLILTHRGDGTASPAAPAGWDAFPATAPPFPAVWPAVSIIVPMRDRPDLLRSCIDALRILAYPGRTTITIVDNNSVQPETHALLARLKQEDGVRVLPFPGGFNFAAMINHAVENTTGEMLCFLNNDVEARDGAWLEAMVRHAMGSKVGAVGARLLYPDGTIQHAGVAVGIGGAAGHVQKGVHPDDDRFRHWHSRSRVVSAVTAACMVLERSKFRLAGGMDADAFAVDFNDVDLCLRLADRGLRNVLAVEATLIHHESQSRGARRPADDARFVRELATLRARWGTETRQDPHHSPRFRREAERCVLAF